MKRTISQGGIHPEYYEVTIVATNGTKFKCGSTKNSEFIHTTFDKYNHTAWNKGNIKHIKTGRVAKFQNKYKQEDDFDLEGFFGKNEEVTDDLEKADEKPSKNKGKK